MSDLQIERLDNGNLKLTLDEESRAELAEALDDGDWWNIFHSLFEPYFTNGSYEPFDAGDANPFVGLSSAPCIAEAMDYPDSGPREIVGEFWYFGDYMIRDPLEELRDTGETIFTLAREEG